MEEESHGPENVYAVLGEDARGDTGKQSGGERVGLGVGGIQEVETEGKRVTLHPLPSRSSSFHYGAHQPPSPPP